MWAILRNGTHHLRRVPYQIARLPMGNEVRRAEMLGMLGGAVADGLLPSGYIPYRYRRYRHRNYQSGQGDDQGDPLRPWHGANKPGLK